MSMVPYIRDKLIQVFNPDQADVLSHVIVEAHDALATKADVQELRDVVADLAGAQRHTDQTVAELAEAQRNSERSMAELRDAQLKTERGMAELRDAQRNTEQGMAELRDAQRETERKVGELADLQRAMLIRLDKTDGRMLEIFLRTHLPAYIGKHVKRCRIVDVQEIIEEIEPLVDEGTLAEADIDEVRRLDLLATGILDGEVVYLVGEVSRTGDNEDIYRAARRAAVLRRAGKKALPIVACDLIGHAAAELARREGVSVLRGGSLLPAAG
jgi:multidrug efflux pump subunit AcrA (membrane-fusion protein)